MNRNSVDVLFEYSLARMRTRRSDHTREETNDTAAEYPQLHSHVIYSCLAAQFTATYFNIYNNV